MEWDSCFCDIVKDPLGIPTQLSISLYLLPVLRGRFGRNVHVTRFASTSMAHLWCTMHDDIGYLSVGVSSLVIVLYVTFVI